jgi:outer membrane protein assembly factor BamB
MMKHLIALACVTIFAVSLWSQEPAEILTRPAVPSREALERLNLKMAWRVYLPTASRRDGIHSVVPIDNQVFVLTRYGLTVAHDLRTGAVQWRTFVGAPYSITRPLQAGPQLVNVVNQGNRYALKRATGEAAPPVPVPIEFAGFVGIGEEFTAQHHEVLYTVRGDGGLTAQLLDGGFQLWRIGLSGRVARRPYVTNDDVFVAVEGSGLFRIDRETGDARWNNVEATRFVAANPKFVYAMDRLGQLLVLDYVRGTKLSTFDTRAFVVPIGNEVSDRIFLASHDGLLICLHDRDYTTPLRMKAEGVPKPAADKAKAAEKADEKPPEKAMEKGEGEGVEK